MEQFDAYSHALAALAGWGVLMVVLMGLSTGGRSADNRTASGAVKRDYADPAYRKGRAFANAIETTGPFLAVTLAAILLGANPFWVNLLASVFLVGRIFMAVVHVGTENQGLRSLGFSVGFFAIAGLAGFALVAAFT
jgi:uncharacterized MAPEG superfamily protein